MAFHGTLAGRGVDLFEQWLTSQFVPNVGGPQPGTSTMSVSPWCRHAQFNGVGLGDLGRLTSREAFEEIQCRQGLTRDPRAGGDCIWPTQRDPVSGTCRVFVGDQAGPDGGGQAVMGRYGAGMVPGADPRIVLECLPGMVLGDDNVCYNKGQVPNKRRKWPAGRRPLLTGGDMAAISKAARAATRLKNTTKRLQKMGMIAKPAPRRAAAAPKQIAPPRGQQFISVGE